MNDMLLVIVLAGRRAALPAIKVNAVIELTEVTPVPRTAAHVVGLAALRSRPLTVIDCSVALGVGAEIDPASGSESGATSDWRTRRAVIVEDEGHLYGLLVDAADDIVAAQGELAPLGADPGQGWQRVSLGRVETEAGALPLLDISALIAGPGTAQTAQAA